METIKGIVKSVKKDKKGVQLESGKWYSNKFGAEVNCNVGDEVEITYTVNGDFNNHESVKVLKKASSNIASKVQSPELMLLSYAKDYACGRELQLKDAIKEVMIGYYGIQEILGNKEIFLDNVTAEAIDSSMEDTGEMK